MSVSGQISALLVALVILTVIICAIFGPLGLAFPVAILITAYAGTR